MKCLTRPFGGPVKIDLTPAVQKIFEQYAQIYGLACVDEAVEHAARRAIERSYLLRVRSSHSVVEKGRVIHFGGFIKAFRSTSWK
ncbi:hypothetical protein C5H23_06105 [Xylella fastidiosa]|nr:hypothetical protein C5H23_06105 [Xylella fastidiosa]TNV98752.1 hypothetical protein C5H21_06575 [Xylella fastidiosa]